MWEHDVSWPSAWLSLLTDPHSSPSDEPQVARAPDEPIAVKGFYRWTLLPFVFFFPPASLWPEVPMCHKMEGRKCKKWRDAGHEWLEQFNVNSLDDDNKSISSQVVMLGCRGAWPAEPSSEPIVCFTAGGLSYVCMKIQWVHCHRLDQSKDKKKKGHSLQ